MKKPRRLTIADSLKQAIKASKKTVNAIAVESGIAQPVLQRFVAGTRDLKLATAQKLADHFGLELRRP